MKSPPHTSRGGTFFYPCLALAVTCLVLPLRAQIAAAKPGESILGRRYKAAQDYQARQQLDQAAEQYRIFIADALGELAMGYAKAGNYQLAANQFDEALSLVPDFPSLQLEYARIAMDFGKLEHARAVAEGVLRTLSGNQNNAAKAHAMLGRILLKTGDNAEAKQEMEQAVRLDPTFDNGYTLAIAELNLGEGSAVATLFTEMQASYGDTATVHLLFGQAYGGSDMQADAVREFQRAIALDDRLPGAHYSLASAYLATQGNARLADVKAELRKEIANTPNSAAAFAALGHLMAAPGGSEADQAEGVRELKHAIELQPDNPDPYLYLGQYEVEAKSNAEAEVALRRSITLTTDPSRNGYQVQRAHYLLGRLLVQSGRSEAGKEEIALSQQIRAKNLKRDQDRLSDYLGESSSAPLDDANVEHSVFQHKQEDAEALKRAQAFTEQFGSAIADSYNNLGAIAGSKKDYRLALRYFESAAQWNPGLPGLDYNWGRAAFAAEATQEAIGPLTRYAQAHPDDEGAHTVLGLSQFLSRDFAGARKTLGPFADKPGESSQVQYAYADSLVETSSLTEGIQRLRELEKKSPEVAEIHRALGEAYALQKSPQAVVELERAIELDPGDAAARTLLAQLKTSSASRR